MNKLNLVLGLALLCIFGVYGADEEPKFTLIGGKKPITDAEQLSDLTKNVTVHLQKLGAQENGTFELIQLHTNSATSQVVAGILYELLAEVNENNRASNCSIKLWEKPWENFVQFDVVCGDEKRKYQYKSENPVTEAPAAFPVFGGFSDLSTEGIAELHTKLAPAFTQLATENDDFNWIVKRILSATYQVVAGSNYVANLEVTNTSNEIKNCNAEVWEKTWENFLQVKLDCDGKKYQVVKQKSA